MEIKARMLAMVSKCGKLFRYIYMFRTKYLLVTS